MAVIAIKGLTRTYAIGGDVEVRALRGVDLEVQEGEMVAIMGPSGSGKSTMMNILGCLDKPTSGSYLLNNEEVCHLTNDQRAEIRNKYIGFVFQGFNLLARTSAIENVEVPLLYTGKHIKAEERARRSKEALERVGLGNRLDHVPTQLSGGEQQRVAIARAIVNRPLLLIADEPTGNLDPDTSKDIMETFKKINHMGTTVLMVTHDKQMVDLMNKRVIEIVDGKIARDEQKGGYGDED